MNRVRIDDFARYQYVNSVRVAPDGGHLVYALTCVDLEKNCYPSDLWTLDLSTGAQRRLTASGKEGHFEFTDDGAVLFASRRGKPAPADKPAGPAWPPAEGDGPWPTESAIAGACGWLSADELAKDRAKGCDLYRIALDGGEAELFAHVPLAVLDWLALPGGRLLVRGRELADTAAAWVAAEEIPFWENGDTYTAGQRWGLYLVDPPAAGDAARVASCRLLTDPGQTVCDYVLDEERTHVYLLSSTYADKMPITGRASAIDLATGEQTPLGPEGLDPRMIALVAPDTLLVASANPAEHGINTDPQVFRVGTDGSGWQRVSAPDFDVDFYNHITSDARQGGGQVKKAAGGRVIAAHALRDASVLSAMDASGATVRLTCGAGSVDSFDTLDGRDLYYVAMRPNMLPEIYHAKLDAEGRAQCSEERLTNFSSVLEGSQIVAPESFDFVSNDATLTGYVIKPADYEPGKRYPGVLFVHGGPKCVMGDVLFHQLQYLAGLGYFVFYTNPHGSGGRGIEYAASIFGGYGTIDFDDLMTFTDEVLRRYPDIDPERIGQEGGSYGGFMTNWIMGHTSRFACHCSQRSISNWVSMFGVSDIGYYFADDQTLGWPWGNVETMWDQSPLKYADQVKSPALFLHADEDYRCPLEQGMQMFTALKIHGIPARLVVFKGENHELSRSGKPQARVRRLTEIANWYARWLKGDELGEPTLRG